MGRVLTVDRRLQILKLLEEKDQVHVFDLSRMFNVSEVTIRNDLDQLEKKNLLIRARGGAIKANKLVSIDRKLDEKSRLNEEQKKRIGKI